MAEFQFTWKIENFNLSVVKIGGYISSPEFFVDYLGKSVWFLQIYPYGNGNENSVACYLCRSRSDDGQTSIPVDFTLSLVMADGSEQLCNKYENQSFRLSDRFGCLDFKKRDELMRDTKLFLMNGMLTVRCYIQLCDRIPVTSTNNDILKLSAFLYNEKSVADLPNEVYSIVNVMLKDIKQKICPLPNKCLARTKIRTEKRSLVWYIENFTGLDIKEKIFLPLLSASRSTPPLMLVFYLDDEPDQNIHIELKKKKEFTISFSVHCEIQLLDNRRKLSKLKHETYFFEDAKTDQVFKLSSVVKKSKILNEKDLYLKDGVLSLLLKFVFSDGEYVAQIEETGYFSTITTLPQCECESSVSLRSDFSRLVADPKFCDFVLLLGDKKFPVHRAVLSARSPVFKAMFEGDMAEKANGVAEVKDVDEDTLSKMLIYIYSGVLGDLTCDLAGKLYSASDKYECLILKEKCSSFLQANLTIANVCDVLVLADLHQDKELKERAEDFIVCHPSETMHSDEWKIFVKSHVQLAAETLSRIVLTMDLGN